MVRERGLLERLNFRILESPISSECSRPGRNSLAMLLVRIVKRSDWAIEDHIFTYLHWYLIGQVLRPIKLFWTKMGCAGRFGGADSTSEPIGSIDKEFCTVVQLRPQQAL